MLECVVNLSEGRNHELITRLARAADDVAPQVVLDIHTDIHHNRTVFTMAGEGVEEAVRALAAATVDQVDLRRHTGVHPRIGALDVVPFVALEAHLVAHTQPTHLTEGPIDEARTARDRFAAWAGNALALPCFLYGPEPERSLPEVRRRAWGTLAPDAGPSEPHPSAGATAVGARPVLVAYNLWLAPGTDLATARQVAKDVRRPGLIRTLGLQVGEAVQVSCNLIAPFELGPGAAFDAVARALEPHRTGIERAELVGLLPQVVLEAEPYNRWAELDLDPSKTIEARLDRAGLDGGSFR